MSITFVADALGVSPSTVSRWESSASHPAPELAEKLLDLLHAGSETRQCLSNSGVAKIRAERPPYDRERLQARLEALERAPHEEEERSELRFLQLQSVLWWFRDQPGALDLLRRSFAAYAEFLCAHARYRETIEQAQIVVESGLDPTCEIAVRAWRTIARADVYRWPQPRPHGGLLTLQRCLAASSKPTPALVGLLNDMAEYSLLADRPTEAEHYMNRAREAAGDLTVRARLQFVAPRQLLQPVVACPA
jgi:transcriptional regulator with XRE-family HTH domain